MTRSRHQKWINPQKKGVDKRLAKKNNSPSISTSYLICAACREPINDETFQINQFGDFMFRPTDHQNCEHCQQRICRPCWNWLEKCKNCFCHVCMFCKNPNQKNLPPQHVCSQECQQLFHELYRQRLEHILFHEKTPTGKYSATTSITTIIINYVDLPPIDQKIRMRFVYY